MTKARKFLLTASILEVILGGFMSINSLILLSQALNSYFISTGIILLFIASLILFTAILVSGIFGIKFYKAEDEKLIKYRTFRFVISIIYLVFAFIGFILMIVYMSMALSFIIVLSLLVLMFSAISTFGSLFYSSLKEFIVEPELPQENNVSTKEDFEDLDAKLSKIEKVQEMKVEGLITEEEASEIINHILN